MVYLRRIAFRWSSISWTTIRPLSEVYLKARWSIQTNKCPSDPTTLSKERLCWLVLLQWRCTALWFYTKWWHTHTQQDQSTPFYSFISNDMSEPCALLLPFPLKTLIPPFSGGRCSSMASFTPFALLSLCECQSGFAISTDLYLDGTKYALRGCLLSSAGWMALFDLSLQSPVQKRWLFCFGAFVCVGKGNSPPLGSTAPATPQIKVL